MKQILSALFAALLLAAMFALPAAAEESQPSFEVTAEAAYIVNTDTNLVVYEKNSETPMSAASLTKLMTMILLLENYQDQLDTVTVTAPGYIYDLIWEQTQNASTADIWRGETHTLRSLLYAMELPSGNEAAYIVADYMGGGSIDSFVAMMNDEAARIGCTNTVFTDPCGLDPGNTTTARDAYLLLRVAMSYDAFVQAAGSATYEMPASSHHDAPYTILASDKLIVSGSSCYREYTQGGKTGSLDNWQSFAGWHTQDGETYVSVVLHVPKTDTNSYPALTETADLMDWAFQTYTVAPALDSTQPLTELPIVYSTQADTVMLYPADDMQTLLPREGGSELTQKTFQVPDRLTAPIRQGDVVGTVTLSIDGVEIGTVDLLAGSTVDRNEVLYTMARVQEFFSSTYFKVVVILTMLVVAVYIFLWVVAMLFTIIRAGDPNRHRR